MIITELYIKNFGKFSEQRISFHDGVQVIYGENEFGKTTIHAFIRAMLFGLERGRGKAAAKDNYSRYKPWDQSGEYAGVMRFACGDRYFRLERGFDTASRYAYLICENDGEELSVEQGDLEMLLGGLTPAMFDSTVSIGQLMIRPGQELSDALRNYAVNDYEPGSSEIDLNQALAMIGQKRKDAERAMKAEEQRIKDAKSRLEQECAYLEREMEALREEFTDKQSQQKSLERLWQEEQRRRQAACETPDSSGDETDESAQHTDGQGEAEDVKRPKSAGAVVAVTSGKLFKSGAGALLAAAVSLMWGAFAGSGIGQSAWAGFSVLSGFFFVIGLICIAAGVVRKISERRGGDGSADPIRDAEQAKEAERGSEISASEEELRAEESETAERMRRLSWEMERIQSEWKEKEIRSANLQEEISESLYSKNLPAMKRRIQALDMAEERLAEAAKQGDRRAADRVSRRASEIFGELTGGRYRQIDMGSRMELSVWDGHRRIPAERLSRGTLEQIYFSLRMASADVMQEEIMPVILDDTFVYYDENRLKSALKWLSRQERQVIILSCNKRERDLLREEYDT